MGLQHIMRSFKGSDWLNINVAGIIYFTGCLFVRLGIYVTQTKTGFSNMDC